MKHVFSAMLAAGLLLGACFSDRASTSGPELDERLCDGTVRPGVVVIRDFGFHPATIRVRAGEEVRWVNCEDVQHTATADGGAWDSGLLGNGTVYRRTFPAGGSFAYHCEPHPFMEGVVVVE